MQVQDQNKRRQILAAASRLFASTPFHRVRLDDVAAAAHVGKGTLYVYFRGKDELYLSLVREGFAALIERLEAQAGDSRPARAKLRQIVFALVEFGRRHPHMAQMIRTAALPTNRGPWLAQRRQLARIIQHTIRQGVRSGELSDPHPELTALYVPGMVRAAMLFGPPRLSRRVLAAHLTRTIERALTRSPKP